MKKRPTKQKASKPNKREPSKKSVDLSDLSTQVKRLTTWAESFKTQVNSSFQVIEFWLKKFQLQMEVNGLKEVETTTFGQLGNYPANKELDTKMAEATAGFNGEARKITITQPMSPPAASSFKLINLEKAKEGLPKPENEILVLYRWDLENNKRVDLFKTLTGWHEDEEKAVRYTTYAEAFSAAKLIMDERAGLIVHVKPFGMKGR